MPEYLIEESVMKATMEMEGVPDWIWSLFDNGPIIRKYGRPSTQCGVERVKFDFDGFTLEFPLDMVSEIED